MTTETTTSKSEVTRSRILKTTVALLWEKDAAAIRLSSLSKAADVNTSVLYAYFLSREGLIETAYLEILEEINAELLLTWQVALSSGSSDELLATIEAVTSDETMAQRFFELRQMYIRIVAVAVGRKGFAQKFAERKEAYLVQLTSIIESLRERGFVNDILPSRQIALVVESLFIGRCQDDISLAPEPDENWTRALVAVLTLFRSNVVTTS